MSTLLLPQAVRTSPVELYRSRDVASGSRVLRDQGRYVRVRAGVYAPRAEWDRLKAWERYLARVHAYALVNRDAVFSHESAAALLGLPLFGEPRDIHTYDLSRKTSNRFGDVFAHASADEREVVTRGGLLMTSPTATAIDLMRLLPGPFGLALGDAVTSSAQDGTATRHELQTVADRQSNRRGDMLLTVLLAAVDPRSESPGESVGRAVIIWSGFEPPELQLEFRSEGFVDRVDYSWRSVRGIAESDGYAKYLADTPAETVKRVVDEKRREDRLRRQCDVFGRWDMAAAMAVKPVVKELERMGIPRVAAPRAALLAAMRSNSRSFPAVRHRERDETPPIG